MSGSAVKASGYGLRCGGRGVLCPIQPPLPPGGAAVLSLGLGPLTPCTPPPPPPKGPVLAPAPPPSPAVRASPAVPALGPHRFCPPNTSLCVGPGSPVPRGLLGGPGNPGPRGLLGGPGSPGPRGLQGEPLGGKFLLSGPLSPTKTKPALLNGGISSSFLAIWGITKTDGTSPGTCARVRWQSH